MVAVWLAAGKMIPMGWKAYRRLAIWALRIIIGAVFIDAGQAKIREASDFAENIASFRLLPPALSDVLAMALPPFEILLGLLLVVGWRPRMATFCGLLTSGVFLLALISAWVRGIPVECGCFGSAAGTSSSSTPLWLSIARDLALMSGITVTYVEAWNERPRSTG